MPRRTLRPLLPVTHATPGDAQRVRPHYPTHRAPPKLRRMWCDVCLQASSHLSRFTFKVQLFLSIIGCACYLVHYNRYSNKGEGNQEAFVAGDIFMIMSELVMIALLFALAKVWYQQGGRGRGGV